MLWQCYYVPKWPQSTKTQTKHNNMKAVHDDELGSVHKWQAPIHLCHSCHHVTHCRGVVHLRYNHVLGTAVQVWYLVWQRSQDPLKAKIFSQGKYYSYRAAAVAENKQWLPTLGFKVVNKHDISFNLSPFKLSMPPWAYETAHKIAFWMPPWINQSKYIVFFKWTQNKNTKPQNH